MKKHLIAGAGILAAGCLLVACSGGDSGTAVKKVDPKPPPTDKVESPDAAVQKGLVANKDAPPDAPKPK